MLYGRGEVGGECVSDEGLVNGCNPLHTSQQVGHLQTNGADLLYIPVNTQLTQNKNLIF